MDLDLTSEQGQLVEAFSSLYSNESTPERVRAAEELGFDPKLWAELVEIGVLHMAVGEVSGGWGATLLDLALIAELQGRYLATAPVIEAQVAIRLLERLGGSASTSALAEALADGWITTLGLHPVAAGVAPLVPQAAIAHAAVISTPDAVHLISLGENRNRPATLASGAAADVTFHENETVLTDARSASAPLATAEHEWLVLTAAALVGMGARALEIGVEYVKERKAWGVPVGSFQSVAHALADSATAIDGARLLTHSAAWAAPEQPERARELAAMAFAFAYETARDVTYKSLHFHGGYGFMLEYDIQLYYRRTREMALLWGDPATAYQLVADHRYGPRAEGA
jgi:alkylation response protein AidB-like acyl-CoA dehydrogenase